MQRCNIGMHTFRIEHIYVKYFRWNKSENVGEMKDRMTGPQNKTELFGVGMYLIQILLSVVLLLVPCAGHHYRLAQYILRFMSLLTPHIKMIENIIMTQSSRWFLRNIKFFDWQLLWGYFYNSIIIMLYISCFYFSIL